MAINEPIPAVVTAGGRLTGSMATEAQTDIKALVQVGGEPVLARVVRALRETERVREIVVVGPKVQIESVARQAGATEVLEEEATGPENFQKGLAYVRPMAEQGRVILSASDLPFLSSAVLRDLLTRCETVPADIVFPVVTRAEYEAAFPQSPNTFAKLAGQEYTGGSVFLVRPEALERNHALIARVFEARKSQWQMARLLGIGFALRFVLGRLTIPAVEARAMQLTGCTCHALPNSNPLLAADMDTLQDLQYVAGKIQILNG